MVMHTNSPAASTTSQNLPRRLIFVSRLWSTPNARSAPMGWEAVVADLADKHADELERRVAQLRRLSSELRK
jgi:hypothetical protein